MKRWIPLFFFFALVLAADLSHANIYGYQDEQGVFHFTNVPPVSKRYRTVVYSGKQFNENRGLLHARHAIGQEKKELIGLAKTYLGWPYKLGGNSSDGIDCSAYVKRVFSAFDVKLPRTAREQFHEGIKVDKDRLAPGDLVFFRSDKTTDPAHVGIVIDDDRFIHASPRHGGGVRIDSLTEDYYRRTFLGGSRLLQ